MFIPTEQGLIRAYAEATAALGQAEEHTPVASSVMGWFSRHLILIFVLGALGLLGLMATKVFYRAGDIVNTRQDFSQVESMNSRVQPSASAEVPAPRK